MRVAIVGAGLAGSECAYVLAKKYKISVTLFEMKKIKMTPAQVNKNVFAELVCSNTFKSVSHLNASGLLKHELKKLGSLVLDAAYSHQVPAGEALAVDRNAFSHFVTKEIKSSPYIEVVDKVVESLDDITNKEFYDTIVVATGPLTEEHFIHSLSKLIDKEQLYFYDAIAPILNGDTIDRNIVFKANRKTRSSEHLNLNKEDEGDYLNIPLSKKEYFDFIGKVKNAPKVPHHDFEDVKYFESCKPIEALVESGDMTLAFSSMKAKGLFEPKTGQEPFSVVQLRKEQIGDESWNMVGFQTRMTWQAQKEVFRTLPGLSNVEFFRLGSLHRNTYFISPDILNKNLSFKANKNIFLAGQIMGVEGYLESTAMGNLVGHIIGKSLKENNKLTLPPKDTALGSLCHYLLYSEAKFFSPVNIHWGLIEALEKKDIYKFLDKDKEKTPRKFFKSLKREALFNRACESFKAWYENNFN